MQRSLDRLLDRFDAPGQPQGSFPVNVYETPEELILRADLPGVGPDGVEVQLHQGRLHLRAARRPEPPEGADPLLEEVGGGEYARSFSLAIPVDPDQVRATAADGVVEVRIRKSPEARPRRIPVERDPQPARGGGA